MKALEGIRVLDLTQAYSGPFCTMHLADHGAEVIKIERPGRGDQSRTWGPFKNDYSGYFVLLHRNKKGITLDINTEEGKEIFFELVKTADVVCENFKVGTMDKLGAGYDVLKEINPKIVYASISGFGLTGPLAKRPTYDIVAQAMSGMVSVTGYPDAPPVKVGPSIADNYSGTYLALGICMALINREKTGVGQRLDVAMVDTMFSVLENFVVDYTIGGKIPSRAGNIDPGIAPFDSFEAKDGMFVLGVGTNAMFEKLCNIIGKPEVFKDPRFLTNDLRCQNYLPDLKDVIEEWTKTKTKAEIEEILVEYKIPVGQILSIPEVAAHPQTKERNMLVTVDDPVMGEVIIPGVPIKLHSTPGDVSCSAPTLGQHTEEVLQSIGITPERMAELKKIDAI